MLQYDNSAFYFFLLSTISFYIVPSWYSILKSVISSIRADDESIGAVSRTSAEKAKAEKLKEESRASVRLKSKGFLINLAVTLVFTALFAWLLVSVSEDGVVQSFDPFSILEIDSGSDAKAIKKAYRKLSLMYHPDKNPGDRAAEAKFMMVSKAYEALTDETARENWEKFGNPDGKQSLEVSIGLPSFLLDSKNRNLVLVAYLIFMVGLIPYFVWRYYSDSSKYGEKNVMYDTYSWFHHALSEDTAVKSLPEIVAGSAEFRKRNAPKTAEEKQAVGHLMQAVRSNMVKPKYNHPVIIKGNVLLHCHLLRKNDLLDEKKFAQEQDDLKYMLRTSTSLLDAMISVCKHRESMQTAINCIELGQYIAQAMWAKDSNLLQIPHLTPAEIKHIEKGKQKVSTIAQYREQAPDQRKGLADFSDVMRKDVDDFLKMFPDIDVETKVFVDDDEDDNVYEGDLVTIQVKITRNHLQEGEKEGYVHAPYFPFPKKDCFWVILGQIKEGKILSIEKITNPLKTVVHEIKFLAPPKGTYHFDLVVKSGGYVGIDRTEKVEMVTLDNSTLPEYKIHPDDAQLDDEPTLFEEILNAHIEQDSDDEEDSDEEDEVPRSAAAKKKEQLRRARHDDDDDSDDDEAEEVYADK